MGLFFTADWHLGETRFEILQRPFSKTQEMSEEMIRLHNQLVGPEDTVYVVGDVAVDPEFLPLVEQFNGVKRLIRGNHDRKFSDKDLAPYFEEVVAEGDGVELEYQEIPLYVTHYPSCGRADHFNLVGHIHSTWKMQLNALNVGVDVHHFRPLAIERIPFFVAALDYYDQDVWVAYQDYNANFQGKRGRPSSYLDELKH